MTSFIGDGHGRGAHFDRITLSANRTFESTAPLPLNRALRPACRMASYARSTAASLSPSPLYSICLLLYAFFTASASASGLTPSTAYGSAPSAPPAALAKRATSRRGRRSPANANFEVFARTRVDATRVAARAVTRDAEETVKDDIVT